MTPLAITRSSKNQLGFGVGNEKASSTNAVLLSVLQDATGRLASKFKLCLAL